MKFPGNIGEMLSQASKMKENMEAMQAELEKKVVEANAGAGMVCVRASGAMSIVSVKIDPSIVDSNDVEMLEDLVASAANEALRKAKDLAKEELSKLTGGLSIPGFS